MIRHLLLPLAALSLASAPVFAQQKPLVIIGGQTQRLPAATTLGTSASTTGAASLNLPQGTAPTSPANGDIWTTSGGVYARAGGVTTGPLATLTNPVSTLGSSVTPFVWQPYATTVGTTNASAVITVAGGDVTKFRNGDNIIVAGCALCDTVISGGGTTSVTLNATATATNASAAATVGLQRYSTTSAGIANSLGVSNLNIGAAALGYGDWSGLYDGPGRYLSIGPLKVISNQGTRSATFASRLSDTPVGSGLPYMENVVHMAILDSKPSGVLSGGWNVYNESRLLAASAPSTPGLGFISVEDSIYSEWASPTLDPYLTNVQGYTENFRPDCGTGSGTPNDCSAAIHVINNGARYKSGIIFSQDALDTTGGTAQAPAIALGPWQGVSWYRAAGSVAFSVFSNMSVGNGYLQFRNGPDAYLVGTTLSLSDTAGSGQRQINIKTSDVMRWTFGATTTAESGGNAGADLAIARFNDAGTYQGIPLFVQRSTGNVGINQSTAAYPLDVSGTANATAYRAGGTAGVSCSGTPTALFASVNGIVTHC